MSRSYANANCRLPNRDTTKFLSMARLLRGRASARSIAAPLAITARRTSRTARPAPPAQCTVNLRTKALPRQDRLNGYRTTPAILCKIDAGIRSGRFCSPSTSPRDFCEPVRHRPFVFTLPKRLRLFFRFDRRLLGRASAPRPADGARGLPRRPRPSGRRPGHGGGHPHVWRAGPLASHLRTLGHRRRLRPRRHVHPTARGRDGALREALAKEGSSTRFSNAPRSTSRSSGRCWVGATRACRSTSR